MEENNNMTSEEGKTFTQEQVNAIIGERLAKEKQKADAALLEREQGIQQRELALLAKERLAEKGLSPTLLDALNASSPEALDKSITIIADELSKRPSVRITGMTPFLPDKGEAQGDAGIRRAMGLE